MAVKLSQRRLTIVEPNYCWKTSKNMLFPKTSNGIDSLETIVENARGNDFAPELAFKEDLKKLIEN